MKYSDYKDQNVVRIHKNDIPELTYQPAPDTIYEGYPIPGSLTSEERWGICRMKNVSNQWETTYPDGCKAKKFVWDNKTTYHYFRENATIFEKTLTLTEDGQLNVSVPEGYTLYSVAGVLTGVVTSADFDIGTTDGGVEVLDGHEFTDTSSVQVINTLYTSGTDLWISCTDWTGVVLDLTLKMVKI